VLLCLVTAIAATGAWLARKYYLERAAVRLNAVDTQRYARDNAELGPPERARLVFIGDSHVEGWAPKPALADMEIVWRGMNGETSAQLLYRFQLDALALRPTGVVIQSGMNDLLGGVALSDGDQVAQRTVRNLESMAAMAAESGLEVYLLTVVRPARLPLWRRPVLSDAIYDHVTEVNEELRALRTKGVHIVDVDRALSCSSRELPAEFSVDALHLSAAGFRS